ncbi:hypothetical protein ACQQ2N_03045 [Dokdonella sp. MW10]|uniref:hypothetical protein n=1 Tax=Dokdonella sp. MW10 TaxID=2992926 RepID=UPI003F7EA708
MDAGRAPQSGWWMVYLFLMLVLSVAGIVSGVDSPAALLMSIVNGYAIVGLWGWLSQKAIGWRSVWCGYAFFLMAGGFAFTAMLLWVASHERDPAYAVIALASVILSAPLWWAIWRYAFRSPAIWSESSAHSAGVLPERRP